MVELKMVRAQVLFNILFSLGGEWHSKNAAVEVMSTSLKRMMSCTVGKENLLVSAHGYTAVLNDTESYSLSTKAFIKMN